jgi:hypothetical protein
MLFCFAFSAILTLSYLPNIQPEQSLPLFYVELIVTAAFECKKVLIFLFCREL